MSRRRSSLREFLATEAAGGAVLLVATVAALVWANSPWRATYHDLARSTQDWINDGLIPVFFLVVGLEIRRELVHGELRDRRRVALPAIAAVGGMVVPALVYLAVMAEHPGSRGWAVVMPTDIAFALGVVVLLGSRVPASVRLFLLMLGIFDDVGSVVVLAVFYSTDITWVPFAIAVGLLTLLLLVKPPLPVYVVLGVATLLAAHEAGVPGSVAGVAIGLCAPPRGERLEHTLHPWSSFVVVPLFALANAGVALGVHAMSSRVTLAILIARLAGKPAGILAATWLTWRTGIGRLPDGARWRQLGGAAALAGIPFTVSLVIVPLALAPALQDQARVGILVALAGSALLGVRLLVTSRP